MSVRPQIPSIEGIDDDRVSIILAPIKAILEAITGRTPHRPQLKTLGASVSLGGAVTKINEIINRLQEADVGNPTAPIASSSSSGGVTSIGISGANGIGVSGSPVTGSGTIGLSLGDITPTSINFGQTSLSYYGEGTWTPVDSSGAGLSFSAVGATYERIGREIVCRFTVTYPATASGAGSLIGGLPFATPAAQEARQGFMTLSSEPTATNILTSASATTFFPISLSGVSILNSTLSADFIYGTLLYHA